MIDNLLVINLGMDKNKSFCFNIHLCLVRCWVFIEFLDPRFEQCDRGCG